MALADNSVRLRVMLLITAVTCGAGYWVWKHAPERVTGRAAYASIVPTRLLGGGMTSIDCVVRSPKGDDVTAQVAILRASDPPSTRSISAGSGALIAAVNAPFGRRTEGLLTTDSHGRVTFSRLAAGPYVVVARADDGRGEHLWAAADVTTDRAARASITLTLQPGGTIAGRIATGVGNRPALPLTGVSVTLVPSDAPARASLLNGAPHAPIEADGTFDLIDVPPGHYAVQCPVEAPWSLDAASAGGQDVLDFPLTVAAGAHVTGAVLTVTNRPNRIDGQVATSNGQPARGALIFAFTADARLRLLSRRLQATRADTNGRFTFLGLPGGEYLLAADAVDPPADWFTLASLQRLAPTAAHATAQSEPGPVVAITIR